MSPSRHAANFVGPGAPGSYTCTWHQAGRFRGSGTTMSASPSRDQPTLQGFQPSIARARISSLLTACGNAPRSRQSAIQPFLQWSNGQRITRRQNPHREPCVRSLAEGVVGRGFRSARGSGAQHVLLLPVRPQPESFCDRRRLASRYSTMAAWTFGKSRRSSTLAIRLRMAKMTQNGTSTFYPRPGIAAQARPFSLRSADVDGRRHTEGTR
jgi:hypothetical protein